ncbi:MAG TPA: oxidoreductase [Streptosporangiaceae bacterium]|nr:oxidoreductase [Streptosporangiaceae bacterium]
MSQQDSERQGPAPASRPQASSAPARPAGSSARWGIADIPDQTGRTAVVTGANTGIGLEAARFLAGAGAHVVLAGRNPDKTRAAAAGITEGLPQAQVSTLTLDLAALESVRAAAVQIRKAHPRLDLLINNAGVMMPPYGQTTDGFELQFGTNHLGHFALTGLVLPSLLEVPGSRVVTISSNGHKVGRIHFDDLQWERHYRKMSAYAQSKLANLLFTYELQRRLAAAGAPTIAVAAHPGTASTELTRHMSLFSQVGARIGPHHDARGGALPTVRAATDPAASGGSYYGPAGIGEFAGPPRLVRSSSRSRDTATGQRLWRESERLTGVTFPV